MKLRLGVIKNIVSAALVASSATMMMTEQAKSYGPPGLAAAAMFGGVSMLGIDLATDTSKPTIFVNLEEHGEKPLRFVISISNCVYREIRQDDEIMYLDKNWVGRSPGMKTFYENVAKGNFYADPDETTVPILPQKNWLTAAGGLKNSKKGHTLEYVLRYVHGKLAQCTADFYGEEHRYDLTGGPAPYERLQCGRI